MDGDENERIALQSEELEIFLFDMQEHYHDVVRLCNDQLLIEDDVLSPLILDEMNGFVCVVAATIYDVKREKRALQQSGQATTGAASSSAAAGVSSGHTRLSSGELSHSPGSTATVTGIDSSAGSIGSGASLPLFCDSGDLWDDCDIIGFALAWPHPNCVPYPDSVWQIGFLCVESRFDQPQVSSRLIQACSDVINPHLRPEHRASLIGIRGKGRSHGRRNADPTGVLGHGKHDHNHHLQMSHASTADGGRAGPSGDSHRMIHSGSATRTTITGTGDRTYSPMPMGSDHRGTVTEMQSSDQITAVVGSSQGPVMVVGGPVRHRGDTLTVDHALRRPRQGSLPHARRVSGTHTNTVTATPVMIDKSSSSPRNAANLGTAGVITAAMSGGSGMTPPSALPSAMTVSSGRGRGGTVTATLSSHTPPDPHHRQHHHQNSSVGGGTTPVLLIEDDGLSGGVGGPGGGSGGGFHTTTSAAAAALLARDFDSMMMMNRQMSDPETSTETATLMSGKGQLGSAAMLLTGSTTALQMFGALDRSDSAMSLDSDFSETRKTPVTKGISIYAPVWHKKAQKLYESLGFVKIAQISNYYSTDDTLMLRVAPDRVRHSTMSVRRSLSSRRRSESSSSVSRRHRDAYMYCKGDLSHMRLLLGLEYFSFKTWPIQGAALGPLGVIERMRSASKSKTRARPTSAEAIDDPAMPPPTLEESIDFAEATRSRQNTLQTGVVNPPKIVEQYLEARISEESSIRAGAAQKEKEKEKEKRRKLERKRHRQQMEWEREKRRQRELERMVAEDEAARRVRRRHHTYGSSADEEDVDGRRSGRRAAIERDREQRVEDDDDDEEEEELMMVPGSAGFRTSSGLVGSDLMVDRKRGASSKLIPGLMTATSDPSGLQYSHLYHHHHTTTATPASTEHLGADFRDLRYTRSLSPSDALATIHGGESYDEQRSPGLMGVVAPMTLSSGTEEVLLPAVERETYHYPPSLALGGRQHSAALSAAYTQSGQGYFVYYDEFGHAVRSVHAPLEYPLDGSHYYYSAGGRSSVATTTATTTAQADRSPRPVFRATGGAGPSSVPSSLALTSHLESVGLEESGDAGSGYPRTSSILGTPVLSGSFAAPSSGPTTIGGAAPTTGAGSGMSGTSGGGSGALPPSSSAPSAGHYTPHYVAAAAPPPTMPEHVVYYTNGGRVAHVMHHHSMHYPRKTSVYSSTGVGGSPVMRGSSQGPGTPVLTAISRDMLPIQPSLATRYSVPMSSAHAPSFGAGSSRRHSGSSVGTGVMSGVPHHSAATVHHSYELAAGRPPSGAALSARRVSGSSGAGTVGTAGTSDHHTSRRPSMQSSMQSLRSTPPQRHLMHPSQDIPALVPYAPASVASTAYAPSAAGVSHSDAHVAGTASLVSGYASTIRTMSGISSVTRDSHLTGPPTVTAGMSAAVPVGSAGVSAHHHHHHQHHRHSAADPRYIARRKSSSSGTTPKRGTKRRASKEYRRFTDKYHGQYF